MVVRIELDVDGNLGSLCFGGVLAIEGGRLEDLVLEILQAIGLPVFVVFLEGLPFDHALPFPVLFEEPEFFLERHVFQIGDGWWDLAIAAAVVGGPKPRVVPLDSQSVAPQLELVVFAAPGVVCLLVWFICLIVCLFVWCGDTRKRGMSKNQGMEWEWNRRHPTELHRIESNCIAHTKTTN